MSCFMKNIIWSVGIFQYWKCADKDAEMELELREK